MCGQHTKRNIAQRWSLSHTRECFKHLCIVRDGQLSRGYQRKLPEIVSPSPPAWGETGGVMNCQQSKPRENRVLLKSGPESDDDALNYGRRGVGNDEMAQYAYTQRSMPVVAWNHEITRSVKSDIQSCLAWRLRMKHNVTRDCNLKQKHTILSSGKYSHHCSIFSILVSHVAYCPHDLQTYFYKFLYSTHREILPPVTARSRF